MGSLIDFLNHGSLPFIGRGAELERILAFWQATPESSGLRSLLLLGEAGIGKSRMVEELIPRIHRAGGLAVHAKLLRESTMSILPLIARALGYSETGRQLLKKEPEDNLGSVLAALRRLSRLRPTLLVIEDVHLLEGETVRDLWQLLEGLADETLSVLCTARPVDLPIRSVLKRYLVEEIELEGLREDDLKTLWNEVFQSTPEDEIVATLEEATAGNPLAIRSALRGAIASGAITREKDAARPATFDRGRFLTGLRHDVELLTEGMAAHLSPEEKDAAGALALLGEVFSREAAELMLDNAGAAIEQLIFRGILGISSTPGAPLTGVRSEIPHFPASREPLLAFTHTLVHRYFVDYSTPDIDRLITTIGADSPLYSLLPFQLIGKEGVKGGPGGFLKNAINRTRFVALELSNSPDREQAMGIWRVAESLFERFREEMSPEDRKELHVGLLVVKLSILSQEGITEEYRSLARHIAELTENPESTHDASRRLAALAKLAAIDLNEPGLAAKLWMQAEELTAKFPDLRFTHSYGLYLALVGTSSVDQADTATVRQVERRLEEICADERGVELGTHMRGWILPSCISVFDTAEELEGRLALVEMLESSANDSQQDLMLRMGKILLYDAIGRVDELVRAIDQSLPRFREYNWIYGYNLSMVNRLRSMAAIGVNLGEIEKGIDRLLADTPEQEQETARMILGADLAEFGMLSGNPAWALAMVERFPEGNELIENESMILLDLAQGVIRPKLPRRIPEGDRAMHALQALLEIAHAVDAGMRERGVESARTILQRPILQVSDLARIHATIGLLDAIDTHDSTIGMAKELHTEIRDALLRALEWLATLRLPAYMPVILDRYEGYFTAKEGKSWRTRIAAIQRERDSQLKAAREDGRIRITMLGTISIHHPDGEIQRLQGARLRTVLGLMVANQMLEAPLSHREFCAIATGEDSPERARNIVYVKLHNIRELLGQHALITETDRAPRLNLEQVQVDLLDAHERLETVRLSMREGTLLRASPAMLKALDLTHGEVPFPGLYEEFFEAAREDFENALRAGVISVSRGLLREGDPQSAEEILRRSFEAMPDDEEIGELLREALVQRGKRTEAERVRRRVAAEALA